MVHNIMGSPEADKVDVRSIILVLDARMRDRNSTNSIAQVDATRHF